MDDFLGTSIQYSEYQIKLLEREHYENQQKIVEELINSGFLDSDYEEDTTETETESTDNELNEASLEIKENESPLIESVDDDSEINISPKSLEDDSSSTFIEEEELSTSPSSINDNLSMVLGSDISVVDELNVSNSESINDASINNQIIHSQQREYNDNMDNDNECKVQGYEHENEYDSDEQIQEIQQFDIVTSKAIIRFMEIIFSDIKYLMILFILMIAMPHIIDRAHNQNDNIYGAGNVKYQSNGYQRCHVHEPHHYQTEIYWTLDRATTTHSIINEEDDERDEYQHDDDEDGDVETTKQCINKQHILKFDIISTKLDRATKELRGHLSHHEFKISGSDLLSSLPCHGNKNMNNINLLRMRMSHMNIPIPREMPGLFMKIGAGFKGQQIMGKYTSIATHFTRSHGIYALVMAFVGIAGFVGTNGIDEIITISS